MITILLSCSSQVQAAQEGDYNRTLEVISTLPDTSGMIEITTASPLVSPSKVWTIKLNGLVNEASLTDKIYITNSQGIKQVLTCTVTSDQGLSQISVKPAQEYSPDDYILWVRDIESAEGTELKNQVYLKFTVQPTTVNKIYEEAVVTQVLRNTDNEIVRVTAYSDRQEKVFYVDEIIANIANGDVAVLEFDENNDSLVTGIAVANKDIINEGISEYCDRVITGLAVMSVDAVNKEVTFKNGLTYKLADLGLVLDGKDNNDITRESLSDLLGETNVTVFLDEPSGTYAKFFVIEPTNKVYEEAVLISANFSADFELVGIKAYVAGELQYITVDNLRSVSRDDLNKGEVIILEFDKNNGTLVTNIATANLDISNDGINEYGDRVLANLSVESVDVINKEVIFTNGTTYTDQGVVLDGKDNDDITKESLADLRGETNVTVVLDNPAGGFAKIFIIEP